MTLQLESMPWMNNEEIGERQPAKPPRIIMWRPPDGPESSSGTPVMCASLERAQDAAAKFAGRHPGELMAVYQLVGYSYRAPTPAEFVQVEPIVTPAATAIESAEPIEHPIPDEPIAADSPVAE